ncbi:hypothetical protein [Kocuria kalidii]|uniref:hypothetical protein n=1 Tax=Kocuria kalidii TaxID=3376283 RepID=UPI0037BB5741
MEHLQKQSKVTAVLMGCGAAVALIAMTAGLGAVAQGGELAGPLTALLALGLGAMGCGAALSFVDDGGSTPGLQETISRTRQQIQ